MEQARGADAIDVRVGQADGPAEVGGEIYSDLVWSYETPIPEAEQIAGLLCFYPDRVELTVDGQPA